MARDRSSLIRLKDLNSSTEGRAAREMDERLRESPIVSSSIVLYLAQTQVSQIGSRLTDFDREARRASGLLAPVEAAGVDSIWIRGETRPQTEERFAAKLERDAGLPLPVAVDRAGFRVKQAETGSLEFLLEPLGLVGGLLTSQPVSLFLNTVALLNSYARIRVWIGARFSKDPLVKVSARKAFDIAREVRRGQLEAAEALDLVLDPHPPPSHRKRAGVVSLPDGTHIVGRQITYERTESDGSVTIIHVEG